MNVSLTRLVHLAAVGIALLTSTDAYAIRCKVSVNPINFGIYMPVSPTNVDVNGQIDVRCQAQPGSFTVIIGPGVSGNQLARTLSAGGTGLLDYNLYIDAARTRIWGDGNLPTFVVSGVRSSRGRPTNYIYPVYGRIFAGQGANPGIYNDNLLVTVLF
jgi:spore coat protein U-like protein